MDLVAAQKNGNEAAGFGSPERNVIDDDDYGDGWHEEMIQPTISDSANFSVTSAFGLNDSERTELLKTVAQVDLDAMMASNSFVEDINRCQQVPAPMSLSQVAIGERGSTQPQEMAVMLATLLESNKKMAEDMVSTSSFWFLFLLRLKLSVFGCWFRGLLIHTMFAGVHEGQHENLGGHSRSDARESTDARDCFLTSSHIV